MIRKIAQSALCIFLAPLLVAQQVDAQATLTSATPAENTVSGPDSEPASNHTSMLNSNSIRIPQDAKIELVVLESVSSKTAVTGVPVRFAVANDVLVNGVTAFRAGTPVEGTVAKVVRAVPGKREGLLRAHVNEIRLDSKNNLKLTASDPAYRQSKREQFNEGATNALETLAGLVLLPLELPMAIAMSTGERRPAGRDAVLPRCRKFNYWAKTSTTFDKSVLNTMADRAAAIAKDGCVSGSEKLEIDWSVSDWQHMTVE